ncbi:MAG: hypothetical protein WCH44_10930 [Betaproteobacteria bacterium]
MQSSYAPQFVREMGCTQAEWLRWLPQAIGVPDWQLRGASARVQLEGGALELNWSEQVPLRIALLRMPRFQVQFAFDGLDAAQRLRFMRRFDLYMQRGGG